MLITKEVEIVLNNSTLKHYESKNYDLPKRKNKNGKFQVPRNTKIIVRVEDLPNSSKVKVDIECDCCKKKLEGVKWQDYLKCVKEDGKYYCLSCAMKLYGTENYRKSRLDNSNSFEQWCINNNKINVLDRWDYELNKIKPDEVGFGSKNKYYFKCPEGIHKSELKIIGSFTNGQEGSMKCNACNSFGQYLLDTYGESGITDYWDYEENNKLGINPWLIDKCANKDKIYIKCQEKDYHNSYPIRCHRFVRGDRCPYCINHKVHPLDSLGKVLEDKGLLHLWSDKNDKSPYEYPPHSEKSVYWKCIDNKHEDYPRSMKDSNNYDFRCPKCREYKGEKILDELLTKINIPHDSQHIFKDLKGVGGGLLRFDAPIFWDNKKTKLRGLIEYDGIFHYRWIKSLMTKEEYERTLKHDMMKNLYCAKYNIQLIRIPYWEYDNIEKYLRYYLIENNEFDY